MSAAPVRVAKVGDHALDIDAAKVRRIKITRVYAELQRKSRLLQHMLKSETSQICKGIERRWREVKIVRAYVEVRGDMELAGLMYARSESFQKRNDARCCKNLAKVMPTSCRGLCSNEQFGHIE